MEKTGIDRHLDRFAAGETDPDDPWGRLEDVTVGGRELDLVTGVDGPAFAEHWLATVEAWGRT